MKKTFTTEEIVIRVRKELRQSAWLFGLMSVLSGLVALLIYIRNQALNGWDVAACIGVMTTILALRFERLLRNDNEKLSKIWR